MKRARKEWKPVEQVNQNDCARPRGVEWRILMSQEQTFIASAMISYKACLVYMVTVGLVFFLCYRQPVPSCTVAQPAFSVPSLFSMDGLIRDCVTGQVIGKTPANLSTRRLSQSRHYQGETAYARRASFRKMFDNRHWLKGVDNAYKGLSSSGLFRAFVHMLA